MYDEWTDKQTDRQIRNTFVYLHDGYTCTCTQIHVDRQMDGWMDVWMDGWMDG